MVDDWAPPTGAKPREEIGQAPRLREDGASRRRRRKAAKAAAQPPAELALVPPIQTITPEPDALATAGEASPEEKPSRRRSRRGHHRRPRWRLFLPSGQMVPWILFVIALMVIISLLIVVGERTITEGFDWLGPRTVP